MSEQENIQNRGQSYSEMSVSSKEHTLIFTIGRMNPPTSGHQGLIRQMMEKAVELDIGKVYVLLSSTVDNHKNPLECRRKKDLLVGDVSNVVENLKQKWIAEKSGVDVGKIRACQVIVICMNEPEVKKYGKNPILSSIHYLLDVLEEKKPKKESWLFVGEDRSGDYQWISNYTTEHLGRLMGRLVIVSAERPVGSISATYVRGLAVKGDIGDFLAEMENIGISKERGMEVYEEIRDSLSRTGRQTLKKKSSKKSPPMNTQKVRVTKEEEEESSVNKKGKKRIRSMTPSSPAEVNEESIRYRTRSSTRKKGGK